LDAVADTAIVALVFATLAAAWSWLGSYAGIVSFGHAVFFGIGAYAVAASNLRGGSPWYGALGGAIFAVIVALAAGVLFLRGRGYTFALVTLAAGALAEPFAASRSWLGPHDAFVFPLRAGFLNLQFTHKWPYLLLAAVVFAVTQGITLALRSTRLAYDLRALQANLTAARGVGIRALPPRLIALAVSAFVTSVAGSFCAEYAQAVTPHVDVALALSLDIALIGAAAGSASPWGAPLAGLAYALVVKAVPLHPAGAAGTAVLVVEALAIILIVLLRPRGAFAWRPLRPAPATAAGNAG
jgi:branched-chain amino acid transport system permease protein